MRPQPRKIIVSSCWRGLWAITENPGVTVNNGSSSTDVIYGLNRLEYKNGKFIKVKGDFRWILRSAYDQLAGVPDAAPWRLYEIDADEIKSALDRGWDVDDVRGFENRLEPWQPYKSRTNTSKTCKPADAVMWQRTDGWRVVNIGGVWHADGTQCCADRETTLKYYPNHFEPFAFGPITVAQDAMDLVDKHRPWE